MAINEERGNNGNRKVKMKISILLGARGGRKTGDGSCAGTMPRGVE